MIDLHTHSSESDGTEAPAELIAEASRAGVDVLALTDHDTVAGWEEARQAAASYGITFVPGIELSTRHGHRSVHLLAYYPDPNSTALREEMDRIRQARRSRAESIVNRLSADYGITWDDVLAQTTPGSSVGRPHIADALVELGYVANRSEAFAQMLHPSAGYIEPLYAPGTYEGVKLVRAAGGVPVLAHPATRGRGQILERAYLEQLVEAGLAGLEVEHRENTPDGKEYLRQFATQHGLVMTGSSDYHGTGKPNRLGENTTTLEAFEALRVSAQK